MDCTGRDRDLLLNQPASDGKLKTTVTSTVVELKQPLLPGTECYS